ncbi:HAD family phosphatase [Tropicimonas sp. IMCC6043]|uniref:HAD family hydrolase n=1 Tax=Tropicimonas sp. IMCC6043 TaxID=2510645 RepID=UPI00101D9780|nr:HAD family hydrolase [Tropicimonas sp. IMCC6043]RYH12186.1 haloacid dehalogenase-like hydrolase [Tropicimonas sp. IMCC6043]
MRMLATAACLSLLAAAAFADPLPSWNAGETKSAIIGFVEAVTDPASDEYVTPADRIAVFDNDGTLWSEQPAYFQLFFAIDHVKKMDESQLTSDALKAAAAGDMKALMATGEQGLLEVLAASHTGMSVAAFKDSVASWLDMAVHPTTGMRYDAMVYQPMLELLSFLRDEGFATYIVSGGGIDFIRVFSGGAYNIPVSQVVGSSLVSDYVVENGTPMLMKTPDLFFLDDKAGKPVAINHHIGKRPIFAAGNSDGDFQMLEWTTSGEAPSFGLYVHHTDDDREWAYDREGHIGVLNRGLDDGPERGWYFADMAKDWAVIWPAE